MRQKITSGLLDLTAEALYRSELRSLQYKPFALMFESVDRKPETHFFTFTFIVYRE